MYKNIKFFILLSLLFNSIPSKAMAEEILSWQACVAEAQKNHPDLISANEAVKQSEAAKRISVSGFFPQINSSVDATRNGTTNSSSGNTITKTSNTYDYGANGSQLLFDGFKTLNNVNAAKENIKAANYNYKFTSSEVRLRLRTAFVNLLKVQESLVITQQIYDIRKSNLDLIKLRYDSGMEHKGALLTAEANLAEAGFEIAQANRAQEASQRALIKEMGRRKFLPLRAEGQFEIADAALEKPDFETLAGNNPGIQKLIAQTNAAAFGIKSAQANFIPQLSATGSIDKSDSHWLPQDRQWSAGLSLTFPIFEGGLRFAEVSQAEAIYKQAVENERSARDGVIATLEQAWASLQDAAETVYVQKKFLEAAQERAKIAESQYSLGLLLYDNWTIIEDDLVNAKKTFLNAQANALLAEANWIQAKGDTLEYAQ